MPVADIKVEIGNPRIDNTYELDADYFTSRELHAVKMLTGLRPAEFEDAFDKADPDVIVSLAMVALMRAGKVSPRQSWLTDEVQALFDAPLGKISFDIREEESEEKADAGPPSQTPSESESPRSESENGDSSGHDSSLSSDDLATIQSATGRQHSDTFSDSDPATSAT